MARGVTLRSAKPSTAATRHFGRCQPRCCPWCWRFCRRPFLVSVGVAVIFSRCFVGCHLEAAASHARAHPSSWELLKHVSLQECSLESLWETTIVSAERAQQARINNFRNKLATKMATRQVRYVQKLKL